MLCCAGAQGLAGGLMLCISFVDLLPASMDAVGFWLANVWFYAGVGFFAIIVYFIPEPAAAEAAIAASEKASSGGKSSVEERKHRKAVLMSGIITAIGASRSSTSQPSVVDTVNSQDTTAHDICRSEGTMGTTSSQAQISASREASGCCTSGQAMYAGNPNRIAGVLLRRHRIAQLP